MLQRNTLVNKLPAAWRKYSPGGVRKKITNIPFNGVQGSEIRAMGTKRAPVLANKMFGRRINTLASFNMDNYPRQPAPYAIPARPNPSFDDGQNPAFYRQSSPFESQNTFSEAPPESPVEHKLRLQQELQDLRRERINESKELQDLRERDLARKRIAATRQSYRAYVLDSSKETRGWLRESQGIGNTIRDTANMFTG